MLRASPSHPGWCCLAAPQTPSPRPQQLPRIPCVPSALPVCLGADSGVWGRAGLCLFQADFPEALLDGILFVPAQRRGLQEAHLGTPSLTSQSVLTQLPWPCGPPRAGNPVGHRASGTAAPPHGHRHPFRSALCTAAHAAFPSLARCAMARCLPGGCGRSVPADPTPWERDGGSPAPPPQHPAKKKPCCAVPAVQGRGRGVPGEEEEAATAQGALWDPGWSLAPAWHGCYQHRAQRAQLLVLAGKCLHKGRQCLLV